MAEAEGKRSRPRDLFQGFISGNHFPGKYEEANIEEDDEEIELNLGLSLNGRFGFDPMKRQRKLNRSSSIPDFTLVNEQGNRAARVACAPLVRTCSLPAEAEEDWRKRKEIQSVRRMEAKRKRLEKMKNMRVVRDQVALGVNKEEIVQKQSKNSVIGERGSCLEGSIGSGLSGISEYGSQLIQGLNRCTEARSPASVHSLPKPNEQKSTVKVVGAAMENPTVKLTVNHNEAKEIMKSMMIDMPCVSTRGVGPNGERIEGFLYRYRKGEEVRIVCVCHGSFLSPAEFVKHAGGGDVSQPLKHIVVSPCSLL